MGQKRRKRKQAWITAYGKLWIGVFLFVYLLLVGKNGFLDVSDFRTKTFYVLSGFLLAAVPLHWAELYLASRRRTLRPAGEKLRLRPVWAAVLAYLFFTLLSAAASPYGKSAWYNKELHEGAVTICLYVLCFLTLSHWGRTAKWHQAALLAALSIFLTICFLQIRGGNPLGYYPEGYSFLKVDVSRAFLGTVGNVDLVSTLLSLAAPICLVLGLTGISWRTLFRKGPRPWDVVCILCLIAAALCVPVMLRVRVLCGLVGLAGGLVIAAFVLLPKTARTRWIILGAVAAVGVAAALILRSQRVGLYCKTRTGTDKFVFKLLYEVHQLLNGTVSETFGSGRFFIWRQMLERIPSRLWLGTGPDTVRLTGLAPFTRYEKSVLVATARITDAHCQPLQILYCQGLPALLAWLATLGFSGYEWVRNRRDPVAAALGTGLLCFQISMLFCFCSVIIMPFFWVCLGLLHGRCEALRLAAQGSGQDRPEAGSAKKREKRSVQPAHQEQKQEGSL